MDVDVKERFENEIKVKSKVSQLPRLMLNPQLYAGKVILAPMVRIGTLPMRLLAKSFGAGIKVK